MAWTPNPQPPCSEASSSTLAIFVRCVPLLLPRLHRSSSVPSAPRSVQNEWRRSRRRRPQRCRPASCSESTKRAPSSTRHAHVIHAHPPLTTPSRFVPAVYPSACTTLMTTAVLCRYRATIKAAISGEESGSAIADATNTLLLAEPTKSILKKANEDDDDEVFFGAVSTTEVKKTLQIIKTEKTLPSTITTAAAAATTAEPPAAIRSVVFQKAAPVSVSVTAAPAPAPPASFEQPAAPATSKAAEEAKPAKRPSAIPGPRRSGLPKPKAFSSRLAKPSQKLSSFSSPAKAPVANLKPMKSSSLAADPAPLISLTLEVKEAQVPAAAPSGAVDVGQRETLISFSPMAVKAAAPLISLSPVVTSIPPLISLSPIVTAAAPEPAHDLSPLISLSPVKAPASTPASAINPSLFTALQKAKKPKKLPTVKGGKAVSSTAVKAPSCAVLKPKNSNAAAVDKVVFACGAPHPPPRPVPRPVLCIASCPFLLFLVKLPLRWVAWGAG